MSLFSFTRKKKISDVQAAPPCQHWDLAPRWDSAADMGKEDLVTHYSCCSCGATVSKDEAARAS